MTRILATAAILAAVPSIAMAAPSTGEALNACTLQIRAELPTQGAAADIDFKTIKGTSRLRTLTFRVLADGEKARVRCKVRRDGTLEIDWPSKTELLVKKTEGTSAGGQ